MNIGVRNLTHYRSISIQSTLSKSVQCSVEFGTSIDLLSHIAREHHDDEDACSNKLQSTPKSESEKEKPEFVFSESMLDEFL